MMRVGMGYDIHRLVEGRPLILGGITIPFEKGLEGHSDGDALAHAITDAILGALAMGNIGKYFPDTDPAYKNADSMELLSSVARNVLSRGAYIVNIDANIVTERPKLNPFADAMRTRVADCLCVDIDCVSIKPRTNELVGPEGRGEAISVQAIVLLDDGKNIHSTNAQDTT